MVYQVVLTTRARSDVRDINAYIAQDNPGAALRFIDRLLDDAEALKNSPRRGKRVEGRIGIRRIVHRPYVIYYRIEDDRHIVRILRFWYSARDPQSLRLGILA